MYYYIAEPLTTKVEKRKIEDIKSLLSQLGIAGEFVVASPARTVEEHLELAFKKGFTTIVGIGSDALANQIASMMLQKRYDRAAMGFIPLSSNQQLAHMIGSGSLRDICEALRARLLISLDALRFNNREATIIDAVLRVSEPTAFRLSYDQVQLVGSFTEITLNITGEVTIWDTTFSPGRRQSSFLSRLFTRSVNDETSKSRFWLDRWSLVTETTCTATAAGTPIVQTPFEVRRRPKALKLIVNRDKIAAD